MKARCGLCPHNCCIEEGHTGFCRARKNESGRIVCESYGKLTALALDPIEKKPFARFLPGTYILSAGSYGCNLRCPFCQNCDISMADHLTARYERVSPETLVDKAASLTPLGNVGIAYTYNEPLVAYEYVKDCAMLARERGLINAVITNGYINEGPLVELLPLIDAMNIDLKGFTRDFYKKLSGGLETVKRTIALASERCHVEATTLIIPAMNDTVDEMDALSGYLASINPEMPLHISRFFPRYLMMDVPPTPVGDIYRLKAVAQARLKYVYTGNC